MSSNTSAVLTEESIAALEKRFGTSLSIEENCIQIPKRALHSSAEAGTITIPRELNSFATLRFLGLSKRAADRTWSRYSDFLETRVVGNDDIISFARGTARGGQDAVSADDEDWVLAMKSMGASKVLRKRIMTPGHDLIRLTKTPREWVLQTFQERWSEILSLDDLVLRRGGNKATQFIDLEQRKGNKEKASKGKGSSSKSMDDEAADDNLQAVETMVKDRSTAADEIQLYKGGGYMRMMKAFIVDFEGTRRYDTEALFSDPPTDFSQRADSTYWTKNLELADIFASYARSRNNTEIRTGILNIIIPKTIVESAVQFKDGKHWQEYVWMNTLVLGTPGHLAYFKSAEVLIGPMLCESRDQVRRRHEAGENFSGLQALMLASKSKGMQVAFRRERIHNQLNAEGRLWLEEWVQPTALQKKGAT